MAPERAGRVHVTTPPLTVVVAPVMPSMRTLPLAKAAGAGTPTVLLEAPLFISTRVVSPPPVRAKP